MHADLSLQETQKEWHGTLKSYVIGFIASLLFTALSFSLVMSHFLTGHTLVYALMGLAFGQAIVQLLFFLHVGQEAKPRWETLALCFTVLVLLIIIIGTLWIMHDLDERVMSNMRMEQGMSHD